MRSAHLQATLDTQIERLAAALGGRYRVERQLGSGGMATVYLAEDLKHRRRVAVKVLRPDVAAFVGADRFLREVEIAAGIQHPHVVPLHESGESDGLLWYSMPFVEGESLRERLQREGQLPIAEAARILRDVADAVDAAHRRGVIHRDIKPENIMLSGRHALVTDFGISRAVSAASGDQTVERLTTAGVTLGTPAYMAPEQAAADPAADHRVDIYSLGLVGYEMLAGRLPFKLGPPLAMLAARLTETPAPLRTHSAECPPELAVTIDACISREAGERPALGSVIQLLEALSTVGPVRSTRLERRRFRRVPVAAAVLALAGAGALVAGRERSAAKEIIVPPVALSSDTAAVSAYQRGTVHLEQWRETPSTDYGLRAAQEEFESALQEDPRFAHAWAALGRVRLAQATSVMGYGPDDLAPAKAAADSALHLHPTLPEARAVLGRYYYLRGENATAKREVRRALASRPREAEWLALLGFIEWRTGEWDSSAAHLQAAATFDSASSRVSALLSRLALVLLLNRSIEAADSIARRGLALVPDAFWPYYIRARVAVSSRGDTAGARGIVTEGVERVGVVGLQFETDWQVMSAIADSSLLARFERLPLDEFGADTAYWYSWRSAMARGIGDLERAKELSGQARIGWENRLRANDEDAHSHALLAIALADVDDSAAARHHARRAIELGESDAVFRPLMRELAAIVHLRIGDSRGALTLLRRLLEMDSFVTREQLSVDPVWAPMRASPEFQRLVLTPRP